MRDHLAELDRTYKAWMAADEVFMLALKKQFPYLKHWGDVRYQSARHNEETRKAAEAFHAAGATHDFCARLAVEKGAL